MFTFDVHQYGGQLKGGHVTENDLYKRSFYFIQFGGIFLEITLALSWSGNNYNWNYDAIHAIDKRVTC